MGGDARIAGRRGRGCSSVCMSRIASCTACGSVCACVWWTSYSGRAAYIPTHTRARNCTCAGPFQAVTDFARNIHTYIPIYIHACSNCRGRARRPPRRLPLSRARQVRRTRSAHRGGCRRLRCASPALHRRAREHSSRGVRRSTPQVPPPLKPPSSGDRRLSSAAGRFRSTRRLAAPLPRARHRA